MIRLSKILLLTLPIVSFGQTELPDIDTLTIDEIEKLPEDEIGRFPFIPLMEKVMVESGQDIGPDAFSFTLAFYLRALIYTPFEIDGRLLGEADAAYI